jgi:hypothetical protein
MLKNLHVDTLKKRPLSPVNVYTYLADEFAAAMTYAAIIILSVHGVFEAFRLMSITSLIGRGAVVTNSGRNKKALQYAAGLAWDAV